MHSAVRWQQELKAKELRNKLTISAQADFKNILYPVGKHTSIRNLCVFRTSNSPESITRTSLNRQERYQVTVIKNSLRWSTAGHSWNGLMPLVRSQVAIYCGELITYFNYIVLPSLAIISFACLDVVQDYATMPGCFSWPIGIRLPAAMVQWRIRQINTWNVGIADNRA